MADAWEIGKTYTVGGAGLRLVVDWLWPDGAAAVTITLSDDAACRRSTRTVGDAARWTEVVEPQVWVQGQWYRRNGKHQTGTGTSAVKAVHVDDTGVVVVWPTGYPSPDGPIQHKRLTAADREAYDEAAAPAPGWA